MSELKHADVLEYIRMLNVVQRAELAFDLLTKASSLGADTWTMTKSDRRNRPTASFLTKPPAAMAAVGGFFLRAPT
jgi:hypothetical protein